MKSLGKKEQKRVLGKYLNFPPDAVNGRVHGSLEITTGNISSLRWREGGNYRLTRWESEEIKRLVRTEKG